MSDVKQGLERRSFLILGVPACAALCAGLCGSARALLPQAAAQGAAPETKHPFDEEVPRKFTFRQLQRIQLMVSLDLSKYLTRTLGREKTLTTLKAWADENAAARQAPEAAKRGGGNDFTALKKLFSPQMYQNRLVMEVVESTDRVHQLKVSECLWAQTCMDAGAGEEGYASICHGDYAFASAAFNPKIELVRDKTLMQGHAYCNHRYQLKA